MPAAPQRDRGFGRAFQLTVERSSGMLPDGLRAATELIAALRLGTG